MKSILYVGATLMIGASIYGFVDYKQTKQKKEFKSMYTEKKEVVPAVTAVVEKQPEVNKEAITEKKTAIRKTKAAKQEAEEIVGIKSISDDLKLKPTANKITISDEVTVIPSKESNVIRKKKRKFNIKEFSRAPLRDDIDEEVIKPSKKKDFKKMN